MGTNQTKSKRKYNKEAYRKYELIISKYSYLHELIERHKKEYPTTSTNKLIKTALCEHFNLPQQLCDKEYILTRYGANQEPIPNDEINTYIKHVKTKKDRGTNQ